MGFLTDDELDELIPAEMLPHTTPIPTHIAGIAVGKPRMRTRILR
jgi:hypothetical protein